MMEVFQLPLREIQEKFCKSELVLMGWRSQEQSYKMRLKLDRPSEEEESVEQSVIEEPRRRRGKKTYYDADVPEGLPDRLYNEEGEVDLSKGTLKDAVKYMNAIGIKIPAPLGRQNRTSRIVEKPPSMDELFGGGN